MAANQVRIQLSTRDAALELPEKPGPILVSTNLRRYELSRLVNSLLDPPAPVPFEFLINGSFLRTSIDEFLTSAGLSAEQTLVVEYIRAQLPPTQHATFEHDDWVGSVDVLSRSSPAATWSGEDVAKSSERIVSGSFDGIVRVWDTSGRVVAASKPVEDGARKRVSHIMATKFISPTLIAAASGSKTQLWRYSDGKVEANGELLDLALDGLGHTMGVNSLAVHGTTSRFLTASDDMTACLWTSDISGSSASNLPSIPEHLASLVNTTSTKRRKLSTATGPYHQSGPLTVLKGHTAPVTSTIFHPLDPTVAYTVSRDSTLRTWDLETSRSVAVRTPDAHHTRLTALCGLSELGLLAVGTCYNVAVLVDPREPGASASATIRSKILTLKGHRNEISALSTNPNSGFGLVTGSYDGTCRVWDVRNTSSSTVDSAGVGADGVGTGGARASFTLPRRSYESANPGGKTRCEEVVGGLGVKVFDVVWDREVGIVSSGEDKAVQIDM